VDLTAYLDRVGYEGPVRPDEDTLVGLHVAHLRTFPYENLDIQLGETKGLDPDRWAERLVDEKRGGWCYELNGLFSCALTKIGFRVDRLGGAVVRDVIGDDAIGNHMVLRVDLGRPFIADVGLGDGPLHPFPLEEHEWTENGFAYRLERADGDWWRFHNHEHALGPRFDFREVPWLLSDYQAQCTALQDGPGSVFKVLAMTFRRDVERIRALRELTYLEIAGPERVERRIETFEEYVSVLEPLIDFDLGEDLLRLYALVSDRVAARKAAEEASAGAP